MKEARLIITDGDVSGLLACAVLAASSPEGSVVWCPGGLKIRSQVIANQCQVMGLSYAGAGRESPGLFAENADLIEASSVAMASGCTSVVWPANAGLAGPDGGPDVTRVAAALRRADLITRLVQLDGVSGFAIQTPYADVTDRQLADLILDMDLPIWLCWWAVSASAEAVARRAHWVSMLKAAGWTDPLPSASLTQNASPEVVIPSHRSAANPR